MFYHGGEEFTQTAGGYSRIASIVNDIRRSNHETLLFDGGDTFHGTVPVIQSKGEVLVPVLNKMGFSAMVGHWDFAYGPSQLKNLAQQLNYPVLAINVYNRKDNTLFLPPYIIIEVRDLKIAVIGICCNVIDKTMPARFSEGIKVTDGSEELPDYIQKVKEEGADMVFLLSHNGFPQDVWLLSKCKGVDVCLIINNFFVPKFANIHSQSDLRRKTVAEEISQLRYSTKKRKYNSIACLIFQELTFSLPDHISLINIFTHSSSVFFKLISNV